MSERSKVDAARPWAATVGYSRAIRVGDLIEVSGTSATTAGGEVVAPGDPYRQTQYILQEVLGALAELGATPEDVVRTRVYLTNIDHWAEVGRAHGEVFAGLDPACSFVEISRLMLPELVVEVEATALIVR
ncbi:MAG: RidA family protein [Actinobacteria bacterium]|nr:RidA family protein [Actinomycetota bacterium]